MLVRKINQLAMCRTNWRWAVREIDQLRGYCKHPSKRREVLIQGCGSEEEEEEGHVNDVKEVGTDTVDRH